MGLYERLMGMDAERPKIPVHQFSAILGERARANLNGIDSNAEAQAGIEAASGEPLTAAEGAEAVTLLNTIAGTATAKLARAKEIDDVLMLAERRIPPFTTPAAVRLRLGV